MMVDTGCLKAQWGLPGASVLLITARWVSVAHTESLRGRPHNEQQQRQGHASASPLSLSHHCCSARKTSSKLEQFFEKETVFLGSGIHSNILTPQFETRGYAKGIGRAKAVELLQVMRCWMEHLRKSLREVACVTCSMWQGSRPPHKVTLCDVRVRKPWPKNTCIMDPVRPTSDCAPTPEWTWVRERERKRERERTLLGIFHKGGCRTSPITMIQDDDFSRDWARRGSACWQEWEVFVGSRSSSSSFYYLHRCVVNVGHLMAHSVFVVLNLVTTATLDFGALNHMKTTHTCWQRWAYVFHFGWLRYMSDCHTYVWKHEWLPHMRLTAS